MSCENSDILALIDYFENGTDLSSRSWDNYNYYDLWNAIENGASPPSRPVCGTFSQADVLSVTLAVLGTLTTPSEYLGSNRDFYYLYLKAIGSEDPSPTFTNYCVFQLYQVFSVDQLLLDLYPNAAAAYSVRLLSSTYSGPLVRIRNANNNLEEDFYPDTNNEISLSSETSGGTTLSSFIGSEDGFIVTWYDQSGNSGRDATQATASAQPQVISSGVLNTSNGKASLNSGYITALNANVQTGNNPYSVFNVGFINQTPLSTYSYWYINPEQNGSGTGIRSVFTNELAVRVNGAVTYTQSGATTQELLTIIYDGTIITNHNCFSNGSAVSVNTGNSSPMNLQNGSFEIGANIAPTQNASYQEVILWANNQSSNRTGIETNINDFFTIF